MRNTFARTITALAAADKRVVLLMGDIGNRLFDEFKDRFPGRFYNSGIAEANMVSVAAGLALGGLRPVCYTIAPFLTARCYEQIRVDLCYHHQPVVLVGVGSGLCYAELGATHQSCEDLATLRVLPGMTVLAPADSPELESALPAALKHDGPVYLRIGKKGETPIHATPPALTIGKALTLRQGRDVCLIGTGLATAVALEAAELLTQRGLTAQVLSMPTIKPLDTDTLTDCFARFRVVATVEEHSVLGGLGGAVAEWRCDQPAALGRLLRCGTGDEYLHEAGNQRHAREHFGLTGQAIAQRITQALQPPLAIAS